MLFLSSRTLRYICCSNEDNEFGICMFEILYLLSNVNSWMGLPAYRNDSLPAFCNIFMDWNIFLDSCQIYTLCCLKII